MRFRFPASEAGDFRLKPEATRPRATFVTPTSRGVAEDIEDLKSPVSGVNVRRGGPQRPPPQVAPRLRVSAARGSQRSS